jgi:hypothetical protein
MREPAMITHLHALLIPELPYDILRAAKKTARKTGKNARKKTYELNSIVL